MENEFITESIGFKILIGGGVCSTIGAWIESINWASVAGAVVMAIGFTIQVLAYFRAARAEKRDIEKHRIEMAILKHQLQKK